MSSIALGRQGAKSSPMGFGAMSVGVVLPGGGDVYGKKVKSQEEVTKLLEGMVANGMTHIDTAQGYQSVWKMMFGCPSWCPCDTRHGEEVLSDGISSVGRDKVFIATKVLPTTDGKWGKKAYIKATCEDSLKRLGVRTIDLFYMHRIDPKVPIEESMEAMAELKAEGKIKYVGLSEASPAVIRRAHAACPLTCVQQEWSLWVRDLEETIVPTCRELGIGVVAYSPLGRGMLTGTVDKLGTFDYRSMGKVGYAAHAEAQPSIARLKDVASKKGCTPAQLALAWLLKHGNEMLGGAGCVPIPGTSNLEHVKENLEALALARKLTPTDMAEIEAAVPKTTFGAVVGAPGSPIKRYGSSMSAFEKTLWTDVPDTPTRKDKAA